MKKFNSKAVYMTIGIDRDLRLERISSGNLQACLERHFQNDGDECKEDKKANEYAIKHKDGRVFSVFENVDGKKLYIVTDGLHLEDDPQYSTGYPHTTILYPEEY